MISQVFYRHQLNLIVLDCASWNSVIISTWPTSSCLGSLRLVKFNQLQHKYESFKSPSKFQQLNRVIVDWCRRRGFRINLYLDDRLIVSPPGLPMRKNETTAELYCTMQLLVAVGGYVSMKKSDFLPKTHVTFLGFEIDLIKGNSIHYKRYSILFRYCICTLGKNTEVADRCQRVPGVSWWSCWPSFTPANAWASCLLVLGGALDQIIHPWNDHSYWSWYEWSRWKPSKATSIRSKGEVRVGTAHHWIGELD